MEERNKNQSSKGFSTITEISEYLSIKTKTLYALVSSGDIPHYRIGRLIRFKKCDIDSWMEQNRHIKKDPSEQVKKTLRSLSKGKRDINKVIKKTVDQAIREGYNSQYGKPDLKGSEREEVNNGNL